MVDPKSSGSGATGGSPPKSRASHIFDDPRAEAIAKTYAESFLSAAAAVGVSDPLEEFSSFLTDVFERNPDFAALITSGMVSRDEKLLVIDKIFGSRASPLFANFLKVLARHERLELLPLIFKEAQLKQEHRQGKRRVQVTSARPLSASALQKIKQQLADTFGFEPLLEPLTDPALLGGLVIRVGDTVYDSSLRNRLHELRDRMRERSLHEIQSGRNRFSNSD